MGTMTIVLLCIAFAVLVWDQNRRSKPTMHGSVDAGNDSLNGRSFLKGTIGFEVGFQKQNNETSVVLDDHLFEEIKEHLRNNRKIEAIKIVREATGTSLVSAKQFVELVQNKLQ